MQITAAFQRHADGRIEGMRSSRMGFWAHWGELAQVFLPRRYRFLVNPNPSSRGSQINQAIIDETGLKAVDTMTSGMMSNLTSPIRPWFELGLHQLDAVPYGNVRKYLAECKRRMLRVFAESNLYTQLATLYKDNGVFGSAAMLLYEDEEDVIRCYNPCLGEFFFDNGPRGDVEVLGREFTMTVFAACKMFGKENLSDSARQLYETGGAGLSTELVIRHLVEPNDAVEGAYPVPAMFKYREVYWEAGKQAEGVLALKPFHEKPFCGARWEVTSNDNYGRSPGMDAMPATRQLQIQQRRKGEAIDKLVRPPMVASVSMKNEPASILPGSVTYVAEVGSQNGFRPAYQVNPQLQEMVLDIQQTQERIKGLCYNDLFLMISSLDTVRTATEIDARREEKLILLGPVIERWQNEVLDIIVSRTFAIMQRKGLLPDPPPELQGMTIKVEYVSMMAAAQRAASTAALERFSQFVGNLAGVAPEVLDNVDMDALAQKYGESLDVSPDVIRAVKDVLALRQQKAQAAAQEKAMQQTLVGVQAAQGLAATQVGGGINALQAVAGNA